MVIPDSPLPLTHAHINSSMHETRNNAISYLAQRSMEMEVIWSNLFCLRIKHILIPLSCFGVAASVTVKDRQMIRGMVCVCVQVRFFDSHSEVKGT